MATTFGSLGEPADKTQNNVATAAARPRHRRSRSRVEGRGATDEVRLSADVTATDVSLGGRRERRPSSSTRDPSTSRQPSIPAPCGGLTDRSPTPRVAPLDLTRPRPLPNWVDDHSVGDEPGAGNDGAPKSGGRKSSLLDKMAHLLLSPGRRQRDGQSATEQTATALGAGAAGGSRSQQGSRRPSNSSLSDSGDSAPVATQLSDSAGSNKTRTPRERGRKDSAAAAAEERNQAGAGAERSRSASASGDDVADGAVSHGAPPGLQQAEPAKREAGGIGGPDTAHDLPTDEAVIAPKRRAVMALRKRFNTGPSPLGEPALRRTEKSKQLKQQAGAWVSNRASDPLSLDDYPSTTSTDGGLGPSGRSGRSASNPNVSRSEMMKVKWGDCTRDKLDLEDQSSSPSSPRNGGGGVEELDMVRGIGVGNAIGMGTVLVRDEIQSDAREPTTDAAGSPLPRRVLRSSSQNARLHSVLDQPSFLRQASPITLEQVLRNTSMRRIFHHHVEKTFCAENIEFYVAVHRYKNLFPNAMQEGAMDTIKQSAEHIYSTFMAPEAPKQINVDVTMGRNVKAKLDNPTKEMFDESQRAIQELVHCSILPKFYQSTEFRTTAEFEEVKQALALENEKLQRMLASLSEQRNRIALLEQKRAMLHQYYNNFEETAAELSRKRREKELRLLSEMGSAYDAPAVRGREAAGGKEAQSGGAPAEQQQEKGLPALRRWALWSDQAKPYTSPLDHLLSIEVIEAKDLVARDKRGFSNPYVVVKYGKQKCTTRTVFKNLNPRWREHFLFNVKQEEAHKLWLTVWDYNVIGSGEFLGCLSFASPKLFINSSDRWWTLEARKDGELVSGKIRLILHFRKQMDRDEELELELQKVRSAIREEMATLQKTSGPGGLWAGRPPNQKDDGAGGAAAPKDQVEKLVRTLNERRQKLEKEVVDRNRERGESSSPPSTSSSSSSSLSLSSSSGPSSSSSSSSLDSSNDKGRTDSLS
ncbi:regulator of g protein signaling domain containing protein [Acanthamoeba castellanii str. Neff]|uniref:Regulator of g protein signaling domain containing protein n=1 Tax=Acanthamoeba castellanii (strain ATCC 30010 / Neff) TaxID=1257118 RepID=L8H423_ACACF|nr:regulator of g protein signaling domain containing protein [Acanthamoeba castellanii str. Neff]ELR19940.1 regulator of g protein signaling domain containing protein [Acanthamoeba castellanii str. Neff]